MTKPNVIKWWGAPLYQRTSPVLKINPKDPKALELALLDLFPEEWIRQKAAELGVVERHRKVDPVVLFWTLVLGFGVGTQRQLSSLRRAYELNTSSTIAPSSFYDRFTPELVALLKAAVLHGISQAADPSRPLSKHLKDFSDVVAADGTILRLHEALSGQWAGCRTNHSPAAIKLHVVSSVVGEGPRKVSLHPGRKAEVDTLSIGPWVKDRLLLFDLGFYKFQKFDAIKRNGGFFISRCKDNANPEIVATHMVWRGLSVELTGKKLKEVLPLLKRDVIDAEVEVSFKRRAYAGKRTDATMRLRLVGVKNQETKEYHLYLTNIPPDRLKAEDVASMYGARWEIELLFKELKSVYALDSLPSSKPSVVESLIYVALLTLMVSRRLLSVARQRDPANAKRMTNLRWAEVFAAGAHRILDLVLGHMGLQQDSLEFIDLLSGQAIDPNDGRERLSDRWLA